MADKKRYWFILTVCLVMVMFFGWVAGCEQKEADRGQRPDKNTEPIQDKKQGDAVMKIESNAFSHGQKIPRRYSGDGEDISPALSWSGLPEGTKELAIICDDPDAPRPEPWVHWVIYKIASDVSGLAEAVPRQSKLSEPVGAVQGENSWPSGNIGYRGPLPPAGHGVHHYHFKLYALDSELAVEAGLDKGALLGAMKGHVLAETELVGTYQR